MVLKNKWPFYYREKVQIYIDIIFSPKTFFAFVSLFENRYLSEQTKTVVQAENNRPKQEEFK